MTNQQLAFETTAKTVIKNLAARNMEGYFFESSEDAVKAILEMMPEGSSVTWGGSETFKETGMLNALKAGNYHLIDRSQATTPEELRKMYGEMVMSDYFFMSSNAITLNGELVNIDGNSNRVGLLVHGPRHVMVLVGMNKLTDDVESAIKRIRTYACPANAKRLNKSTPCGTLGRCGECYSSECMCNQIVITRRSGHAGRIKVFFIAENLGY
ncbi:MAG: lactate utilization protein [Lachnospiraceae bacterium]|nr:lactate utilization protein [Lachnospiraceae bacterium]